MHGSVVLMDDSSADALITERVFRMCKILNPFRAVESAERLKQYLMGEAEFADRFIFPQPVLLLLDLRMPGMNGYDVLFWLNQEFPTPTFRKVVLTDLRDFKSVSRAYQLGADGFLVKPLNSEDVALLVSQDPLLQIEREQAGYTVEVRNGSFLNSRISSSWPNPTKP
jgi:CheY-like chemotaxis protein